MKGTDLKNMRELTGRPQSAIANDAAVDRALLSLAECGLRPLAPDQEARVIKVLKQALEQRAKQVSIALNSI